MTKVTDERGKVPNYVIVGKKLVHQPTGLWTFLKNKSDDTLRVAHVRLKKLVANAK